MVGHTAGRHSVFVAGLAGQFIDILLSGMACSSVESGTWVNDALILNCICSVGQHSWTKSPPQWDSGHESYLSQLQPVSVFTRIVSMV